MCGITGVYTFSETGKAAIQRLQAACNSLRHRGPDSDGIYTHGAVGLAHRRLSVIAPTADANQPFADSSGRYTIIFNGEIFNYKALAATLQAKGGSLRTGSDTEVVLQLYILEGQEFLKRLHGFFAFAVYDAAEDTLFLARDRFGEKPLLYYKDVDKFVFGSELTALLELGVPRELDYTSLYQYLQLTYVPAPASMIKGVKKLLPGHSLFIKRGKVKEAVWYKLPFDAEKAAQNPLTYKQQQVKLRQLMENAVSERLVADVPVGAFLSGGIDSSVVVALAARQHPDLQTFSVGFPDQPFFDETRYARLVAQKYKTNHTELLLTNQDLNGHLTSMLSNMSEPFADSSALAVYALSQHASQKVKVALSGDGADELFGGYNKHRAEYKFLNGGAAVDLVKGLSFLWDVLPKSRHANVSNKVRLLQRFAAGARLSAKDRYWYWATWQQENEALALLKPIFREAAASRFYEARKKRILDGIDGNLYSLSNVFWADWQLVLANDMLTKIDLMGMANGLEIRSPFLDHRVVKFAFSLPEVSKIDASLQKKILVETFNPLLPPELLKRPKKGFEIPLQSFLKTEGRSLIDEHLSDKFIEAQGIFNLKEVKKTKNLFSSNNAAPVQTKLWTLLVFQDWWKRTM
ncbi:asparagine synthase (glutamine-hydrolyzing) [Pontibacter harenae]|uniref:asparagine synthase (glutamine-hydrolyzing) n=1 Tax=Pontibacter harenae TaxID=2894083 RepID=UPI001E601A24|nr:asparagine synthase (glutamine-hydrolyzing) [Pontibacter harenae]MCC9169111.1 asparagine synthase (glutamine-hydrolyzing) [Pontibacter harenae]